MGDEKKEVVVPLNSEETKITEGRIVRFFPGPSVKGMFTKQKKKGYPAIVYDVNENSVDLHIFAGKDTMDMSNIKHISSVNDRESSWDYPQF